MESHVIAQQGTLEGGVVNIKRHHFTTSIENLRRMAEEDRKRRALVQRGLLPARERPRLRSVRLLPRQIPVGCRA